MTDRGAECRGTIGPVDAGTVVRAVFDAFGQRDVEAVIALATDDVEVWAIGTASEVGREEPYRGHEGLREYFADVAAIWRRLEIVPGDLRIAASGVVAFGTAHGETVDGSVHDGVGVIWIVRLEGDRVRSIRITPTAPRSS